MRNRIVWVGVILLALVAAGPLFTSTGFLNTRQAGDSPFLLFRLHQLFAALKEGVFPVRWMPDGAFGLGYPFFHYYAALPYYVAAGFRALGASYVLSLKLTVLAGMLLAGAGMFGWVRWSITGRRAGALLAAAAYTFTPYHLVNVYLRGDSLAEFWAMAWYPLILWALHRASRRPTGRRIAAVGLAYGALLLTHNVSALLFSPFVAVYGLVCVFTSPPGPLYSQAGEGLRTRRFPPLRLRGGNADRRSLGEGSQTRRLLALVAGGVLGLALAAWFWIPALREQDVVQLEDQTSGYFFYGGHFRGADLIQETVLFDYDVLGDTANPFSMGLVQAVLTGLGAAAVLTRMIRRRTWGRDGFILFGLALSTFMITPRSEFLWAHVPLLEYAQFPGRFLSVQAVFGAAAVGALTFTSPPAAPAGRALSTRGEGESGVREGGSQTRRFPPLRLRGGDADRRSVGEGLKTHSYTTMEREHRGEFLLALALSILLAVTGLGILDLDFLPITDADVTAQRLMWYEAFSGNIGTTIRYEYLPEWTQPRPYTSDWLLEREPRALFVSGTGAAQQVRRGADGQQWTITVTGEPARVALPLLYWPGWRAEIDGARADLAPLAGPGYAQVTVPEGSHTVRLWLGHTPLRFGMEMLSLGALLVTLFLLRPWRVYPFPCLPPRKRRGGEGRDSPSLARLSRADRVKGGVENLYVGAGFQTCPGRVTDPPLQKNQPNAQDSGDLSAPNLARLERGQGGEALVRSHSHAKIRDNSCYKKPPRTSEIIFGALSVTLFLLLINLWPAPDARPDLLTADFDQRVYFHPAPDGISYADGSRLRAAETDVSDGVFTYDLGWDAQPDRIARLTLAPAPQQVPLRAPSYPLANGEPVTATMSGTLDLAAVTPGLYFPRLTLFEAGVNTLADKHSIGALTTNDHARGPLYLAPVVVPPGNRIVPDDLAGEPVTLGPLTLFGAATSHDHADWLITLWWRADQQAPLNYGVDLAVYDAGGTEWVRFNTVAGGGGLYPTALWRPGEIVPDVYRAALPDGMPVGAYRLRVALYDPLTLATVAQTEIDGVRQPYESPYPCRSAPERTLAAGLGIDLLDAPPEVAQGDALAVEVGWAVTAPLEQEIRLIWTLAQADRIVWQTETGLAPGADTDAWGTAGACGGYALARHRLPLPDDLPPGAYDLALQPVGVDGVPLAEPLAVRAVTVTGRDRAFEPPALDVTLDATFGDPSGGVIRLWGYNLRQSAESLEIELAWGALARMETDYKYFVHLYKASDTTAVLDQIDIMPQGYGYPTSRWAAGEVVVENLVFDLTQLPAGDYVIAVGWYDPATGDRLVIAADQGTVLPDQRLILPDGFSVP